MTIIVQKVFVLKTYAHKGLAISWMYIIVISVIIAIVIIIMGIQTGFFEEIGLALTNLIASKLS